RFIATPSTGLTRETVAGKAALTRPLRCPHSTRSQRPWTSIVVSLSQDVPAAIGIHRIGQDGGGSPLKSHPCRRREPRGFCIPGTPRTVYAAYHSAAPPARARR